MAYHKTPESILVGKEVKLQLQKAGISTGKAAQMLDVSPGFVSMHLSGRPFSKGQAEKWSKVFGLDEQLLLSGKARKSQVGDEIFVKIPAEIIPGESETGEGGLRKFIEHTRKLGEPVSLVVGDRVFRLDGLIDEKTLQTVRDARRFQAPGKRVYSPLGKKRIMSADLLKGGKIK